MRRRGSAKQRRRDRNLGVFYRQPLRTSCMLRVRMPPPSPFNPALLELACPACAATVDLSEPRGVCTAGGGPLLARYDPEPVAREVSRDSLGRFGSDLWRYRAVLPFAPDFPAVRLGEGGTPLLPL